MYGNELRLTSRMYDFASLQLYVSMYVCMYVVGENVHIIWGVSKDFGASGVRTGALFSHNTRLLRAMGSTAEAMQVRSTHPDSLHPCMYVYALCTHTLHTYKHTYTLTYIHFYIHTYIHAYKHTYISTYIHTTYIQHAYIHAYIHTYTHTYTLSYVHTYTYIHTYLHTYTHTYILTYIHTYILAYIHTYLHTYILTYTLHTYIGVELCAVPAVPHAVRPRVPPYIHRHQQTAPTRRILQAHRRPDPTRNSIHCGQRSYIHTYILTNIHIFIHITYIHTNIQTYIHLHSRYTLVTNMYVCMYICTLFYDMYVYIKI